MEDRPPQLGASRARGSRSSPERGAAIVEFALVVPVLLMILLAAFSGGLAYSQRQSLTGAAREASRLGATRPIASSSGGTVASWLSELATAAEQAATGDLKVGTAGREICVAFVHPAGTEANDVTTRLIRTDGGDAYAAADCFTDGRPADERRVQVVVERDGKFEALVFSTDIELRGRSVSLYEAIPA